MTLWTAERGNAAATGASFFVRDWLAFVPLLAAAALFAPLNQNFGFDPPGWLDTFIYVGYFWHYPEHVPLFDNYYKVSRLPWVLPGYAAHTVFGDIVGSYVLQWVTVAIGGLALYLLLRDGLRDRWVAAVSSVVWVSATGAHGVGGWNYHVLAAADYYLLACWLMLRAGRASSTRWLSLLAGAVLAADIHTHLFFAVFAPLQIGFYALGMWGQGPMPWKRIANDALLMAAGGIAITLLLMAINRASGGAWLFFMPQIEYTRWLSQGNNRWWQPAATWLPGATYLAAPFLALIGATASLVGLKRDEPRRFALVLVLQAWLVLAIYAVYQFGRQHSVIQPGYMAFGIHMTAIPALAVAFYRGRDRQSPAATIQMLVACTLLIAILLLGAFIWLRTEFHLLQSVIGGGMPPLAAMLIAGGLLLLFAIVVPKRIRLVTLALWFGIVNAAVIDTDNLYRIGSPGVYRTMLHLFRQTDLFATRLDPSLTGIKYWFANETVSTPQGPVSMTGVFDSYVSTRGWLGNLLAQQSPALPLEKLEQTHVQGVTCVGLLSSLDTQETTRQAFLTAAAAAAIPAYEVESERYTGEGLGYALSVYRVAPTMVRKTAHPCEPGS